MDTAALQAKATDIRKDILTMITEAGSGHPGGSLSCTDILTALYFGGVMDYNPADPHKSGRDRFILAKGHAAPALYATLAHAGFFPTDELHTLRKLGTRLLPCDTRALPVCLCDFQLRWRHGVFFFCAPGITFAAFPAPSFASRKPVSIKNVPAGRAAGLIVCRWAAGYAVAGGRDGFRLQSN